MWGTVFLSACLRPLGDQSGSCIISARRCPAVKAPFFASLPVFGDPPRPADAHLDRPPPGGASPSEGDLVLSSPLPMGSLFWVSKMRFFPVGGFWREPLSVKRDDSGACELTSGSSWTAARLPHLFRTRVYPVGEGSCVPARGEVGGGWLRIRVSGFERRARGGGRGSRPGWRGWSRRRAGGAGARWVMVCCRSRGERASSGWRASGRPAASTGSPSSVWGLVSALLSRLSPLLWLIYLVRSCLARRGLSLFPRDSEDSWCVVWQVVTASAFLQLAEVADQTGPVLPLERAHLLRQVRYSAVSCLLFV